MNKQLKVDLHTHICNNPTKQDIINLLILAEENNVKALGLIDYNFINIYKTNGILQNIIKNEGLKTYYSGKLVTAVEMVCTGTKIKSSNSFNYYGHRMDVLLYNFDPQELEKLEWFDETALEQKWFDDAKQFNTMLKKAGLNPPDVSTYKYDASPVGFANQWYYSIEKDETTFLQLEEIVGRKILHRTDFIRNFVLNPNGKFFVNQSFVPTLDQVLEIAKQVNCRVGLAHPHFMNTAFDATDYVTSVYNHSSSLNKFKNLDFLETSYMQNSLNQTQQSTNLAKQLNLDCTGGSDYQNYPQMYYVDPQTQEKSYYKPKPGFAIKKHLQTNNGDILIDENSFNKLKDIHNYKMFTLEEKLEKIA